MKKTRMRRVQAVRTVQASSDNSANDGQHGGEDDFGPGSGSQTITRPKTLIRSPSMYKVVLLNDDYTPMEFVIHVLQKLFKKDYTEATRIMLQVHQKGAGVAGVFSYEVAETKVFQVNQYSKQNQYPLKCTLEKA